MVINREVVEQYRHSDLTDEQNDAVSIISPEADPAGYMFNSVKDMK